MDSLTQIVLGAAVGEASLGKKIGRKAALYGAVLGTLPDLDVLWVKNAVESFTEHRGFSHSLITLLMISPLFAWLLKRWHPFEQKIKSTAINNTNIQTERVSISFLYFTISVYLIFSTHALLDWQTVYGTQLLWPLTTYPFGLASVFSIDPLYTLPLLILLLVTIVTRHRFYLWLGIGISCLYLLWALFAQNIQANHFERYLNDKGVDTDISLTMPMPLNTFLWKNITMVEGGYWVSFRSVFDSSEAEIQSEFFVSENNKLGSLGESESIQKLKRFTKSFYQVSEQDDGIWISDLRMGGFGNFVFNFRVAEKNQNGQIQLNESDQVIAKSLRGQNGDLQNALKRIWDRIFNSTTPLMDLFESAEMVRKN